MPENISRVLKVTDRFNCSLLSGGETQDIGQMQPAFDREAVCGSDHHRKGALVFFFFNMFRLIVQMSNQLATQCIKACGHGEDHLLNFKPRITVRKKCDIESG